MKHLLRIFLSVAFMAAAVSAAWAATPLALDRPALISGKAAKSTLLAMVRAGNRLAAAGERGIVLTSDDNGVSWQQAPTPTNASLVALRFIDAKHGWAVGHMGIVLHTGDGGSTWVKQFDGNQAAALALDAAKKSGNEKRIRQAEFLVSDGPDKPFLDLYFDDDKNGFIVGAFGLIFHTTDGGKTWQAWDDHVANPRGFHLYSIRKLGNALYIAGEQGLLLRSDDGGNHFVALASPYRGTWSGILPTRNGSLLAYGLRGNAYVSADRGKTWQQAQTGTAVSISAATQLDDGRIVIVSQAGEVLASRDGGMHFALLVPKTGLPFSAVAQAGTDGLALASLRGAIRLPLPPAQ